MTDPAPAGRPDNLLLFTPVVTAYRGANGWSSAVQRAFVAALARSGVVAAAARSVGRSTSSAYQQRHRAGADSGFARAWDEAQARAGERVLDRAMAGGMHERRTAVWRHGCQVGWRTSVDTASPMRRCARSIGAWRGGWRRASTHECCSTR